MLSEKQFNKLVIETIIGARKSFKLSQLQLGALLDIDQASVSRIETGKQIIPAYKFYMFAEVVNELLAKKKEKPKK